MLAAVALKNTRTRLDETNEIHDDEGRNERKVYGRGRAKRDEDDFGQSTNTRSSSPSSPFPRLTLVDDGPNVCISQGKNVSRTLRGKKSKLR